MADLEGFKAYLRYDEGDDIETKIRTFLFAAKAYIAGAGVSETDASQAGAEDLYDLLAYMIAQNWFDNRGISTEAYKSANIPFGAANILLQLKARCSD